MKIRSGFVANSSSSSFCLYGVAVSRWQWEKIEDRFEEMLKQFKGKGINIDYHYGISEYMDSIVIGTSPWHLDKDIPLKESYAIIQEAINQILGEEHACSWHEDGGYNG
jgi:hypothetical protein